MAKKTQIELFPLQGEFVQCEKPFPGLFGGVGSGKTEGGALKALQYVIKNPLSLGMVGAPTFPMLRDSTLRTIFKVFPREIYKFNKSDMVLEIENGAEILLRSLDDPDKARGPNLAWYWLDEGALMKPDAWFISQARLRQEGFHHQGWVTTTPKGYNWVYQEFVRGADKPERADYWHRIVSTEDNIFLYECPVCHKKPVYPKCDKCHVDAVSPYIERLKESYKDRPEFIFQEIGGQFRVVGGLPFFDTPICEQLYETCENPSETEGCVETWRRPTIGGKYVGGVDFCWGEKGSYAVGQIFDFQTGVQCAKIRSRMQPEEMAQEFVKLADTYNRAYVGAECNGEGRHGVNKMIELGYGDRMFHRDDEWYIKEDKRGWHTNDKTRPVMLGELREAVKNGWFRPLSKNTVSELMSFIWTEKQSPEASEGAYDDEVISSAIAWTMRKSAHFDMGSQVIKVMKY